MTDRGMMVCPNSSSELCIRPANLDWSWELVPIIRADSMKDFPNASFPPEILGIMKEALDAAIATLPDPISTAHVDSIAETILRTAREGERDPATLQRMALMELQISPRG
jgi:hypothetical protein